MGMSQGFTCTGLGMPPDLITDASPSILSEWVALAAALLAVKTEALAAQEWVHAAALAWERERTNADAFARRCAPLFQSAARRPLRRHRRHVLPPTPY